MLRVLIPKSRGARGNSEVPLAPRFVCFEQACFRLAGRSIGGSAKFGQPKVFNQMIMMKARIPEYLRLNDNVVALVRHFAENRKPIAAICHGVQILTAVGVVEGRSFTAYPAVEPEVRRAGGKRIELPADQAHTDGNLVTAPA